MRIQSLSFVAAAAVGIAALSGCANKTEGERTLERAQTVEDAGVMIKRGEEAVTEGKAVEARGRSMKEQGNTTEGNRLINEGEAMQRKGRADIEQGRKMKM